MSIKTVIVGVLTMFLAFAAGAAEHTVSSNLDDGGAGTLRVLTSASSDGDTIRIPSDWLIVLTNEIALNTKSLRFSGEGSGASISGGGTCRLFNVTANGKTLQFDNLCFTNGYHSNKGGAFYVENYATVIISNCAFRGNAAASNSAAIFVGSTTRIYDTVFDGNTSAWAGCYYVQDALTMERCTFINNAVDGTGGVGHGRDYGIPATTVYRDCLFSNNIAGGSGCLYVNSKAYFENCDFISNTSTSEAGGGGAVCSVRTGTVFSNCVFRDNIARDGGALCLIVGQATCIDCIFTGNSRTGGGYGDVIGGSASGARNGGSGIMSNCVFRNNSANAGVISTFESSCYTLYNCLFESNVCYGSKGCISAYGVSMSGCIFLSNQLVDASADQYLVRISGSSGPCTIMNSTFVGGAESLLVPHARGALAIASPSNNVSVSFCTFRGFRSDQGAIYTQNSTESGTSLQRCAFDDNWTESRGSRLDVSTAFTNVECCFFSAAEGSFTIVDGGVSISNLYAATAGDAQLLDPADNDGIVLVDGSVLQTCATASKSSPLRNAGGSVAVPPTDARGMARCDWLSGFADIGAYEYKPNIGGTILQIR